MSKWIFLIFVALVVISIDQITKEMIVQNLALYESYTPIPALDRFFEITYTRNTGAAFGLFSSASNVFLIVAVIATGVIAYYYRQLPENAWLLRASMGVMLGGALGNALDRVTRGYVVDFLHVHYQPHFDYPVFNIADSAIVIGVAVLMIKMWWDERSSVVPEEEQHA